MFYLSFDNNTGDIIMNALDPATGAKAPELLNPVPNVTSSRADRRRRRRGLLRPHGRHLPPAPWRHSCRSRSSLAEGHSDEHFSNYLLLLRTAAEDFMVLLFGDSGGNGDLYFYHYDETLPTHADTTLTVWSLVDSATARLAVNASKKLIPRWTLPLKPPQTDTDDVSAAINDALTQLNTELLAGEGPDVLLSGSCRLHDLYQ